MSSWKTYVNTDYNYSLYYPPEIEIYSTIESPKRGGFIFFSLPAGKYVTPKLTIQHLENSAKLSAKAFFTKLSDQVKREHESKELPLVREPDTSKEIEINEVQALQFSKSQGDGKAIHAYFGKDDLIVDISFTDYPIENDPENQEHLVLFNKILYTFRFIDVSLVNFVKNKLSGSPESSIQIEKIEGDYALGSAGTASGYGFYWAAAKINNQWSYIISGNGIPECREVEIFPVGTFKLAGQGGKFDDCYNDKSDLIDRKTGLSVK